MHKHKLLLVPLALAVMTIGLSSCGVAGSGDLYGVPGSGCGFPASAVVIRLTGRANTEGWVVLSAIYAAQQWNAHGEDAPYLDYNGSYPLSYDIQFYSANDTANLDRTGATFNDHPCPAQTVTWYMNTATVANWQAQVAHTTAAHELGHALGLNHQRWNDQESEVPLLSSQCSFAALMYWNVAAGTVCGIEAPTWRDVATINAIYN